LAALAVVAPALLPVLPLLAARYAGPELVALGLLAVVGCGMVLLLWPARRSYASWIALGQAGVVAVAFGLPGPDAIFAGLVLLALLVLSQAARNRVAGDGLAALVASAGLAGLPPFGVFPGIALVLTAVAGASPWLLPPLLVGVAVLGWASIRDLPPPRLVVSDRWSAAWIPLLAGLLIGWCMPGAVAIWLHAAAMGVHR
jgi:hydrogenase-4 component F